jgi:hypothetical protein
MRRDRLVSGPEKRTAMERSEKSANEPVLVELERLGTERRPIAGWLEKLEGLRSEASPAAFGRVRDDYETRLATIDGQAAPLAREAGDAVKSIDGSIETLEGERKLLELDLQELALRHSLAELTDEELAERGRAPQSRIEAIAEEISRAKSNRDRWQAAIDQGFAVPKAPTAPEPIRPEPPAAPPPAAPAMTTFAPALPPPPPSPSSVEPAADGAQKVDITVPHPIPPPRPSSPAVPLPGAGAGTAIPVRTAEVTPKAPAPPPAAAAPAALPPPEAAGRTSFYVPQAPPAAPPAASAPPPSPSPPPPAPETEGRTRFFSPAPPPDRTVVLGTTPPAGAAAAAVPKARLVAVDGAAQEHKLGAESTLGRVPENTIPIPNGSVSRHHATIRFAAGVWSIVDQKSENGTWVNGERITERKLAHDDRINIGTVRFRFKLD